MIVIKVMVDGRHTNEDGSSDYLVQPIDETANTWLLGAIGMCYGTIRFRARPAVNNSSFTDESLTCLEILSFGDGSHMVIPSGNCLLVIKPEKPSFTAITMDNACVDGLHVTMSVS